MKIRTRLEAQDLGLDVYRDDRFRTQGHRDLKRAEDGRCVTCIATFDQRQKRAYELNRKGLPYHRSYLIQRKQDLKDAEDRRRRLAPPLAPPELKIVPPAYRKRPRLTQEQQEQKDLQFKEFCRQLRVQEEINRKARGEKEVRKRNHQTRTERLRLARPNWIEPRHIGAIYDACRLTTYQTGVIHHVDHIVPLFNDLVCGLEVPWNLRIMLGAENIAKGNQIPSESDWLAPASEAWLRLSQVVRQVVP